MAKTLWDINFSTLDTTQSNYNGWATKATNTLNLATGVYNPNGSRLFVNAVDIDWNGATLDSTVINTTGDLLKYIKAKSNLTLGTTATTAAKGNHTHNISITTVSEDDISEPNKWLVPGDMYKLTAGGSSYTFGLKGSKTLGELFNDEIQKWMNDTYTDQNSPVLQLGNAGDISLPKSFFDLNNDNTIGISDMSAVTVMQPFAMGFIADYAKNWYGKTPSPTYTKGTNITISSSGVISHAQPTAPSGNNGWKGNKTNALLAMVQTDSQGHVTDYDIITPEGLWELIKPYAKSYFDTIYEPKSTPSTASASIGSEYITRPKNSTLKSISWSKGSATSPIESGKTGTLTKGTVTATYGNDDATTTVITSGCTNNPTITSDNPTALSVGTIVKNGTTVLTAKAAGTALITVKDGSKLIGQWGVTVSNETNTSNVTSSTTFSPSAGSINGTTITAPTVTTETEVEITAKYGSKTASTTVKYTATPAAAQVHYYVGQNSGDNYITNSNYTTIATQSAFTTKAVNMTVGNYLYVVVPSTKTVKITDPAGNVVTMNFYNNSTSVYAKTKNLATNEYYLIRSRMTAAVAEQWTVKVS